MELAASAGLVLDDWQAADLYDALGEADDGRWASFEVAELVSRQNGKGSVIVARELAGLFLFGEELIVHTAHEFATAVEAFRRIVGYIDATDWMRAKVKRVTTSHGNEGIELVSGQRLQFKARTGGSGRGFTADCVILDEAYAVEQHHMAAILPTLSSRPNPQVWYTSSAPMVKSEVLHAVRKRGLAGTDTNLCFLEYSIDPATTSPDDRAGWRQANPSFGIRITEEYIARERGAFGEREFLRERLGVPDSADGGGLFRLDAWEAKADTTSRIAADGPRVFAIDVAPDRGRSSIGVAGDRDDGLRHVEVVDCHDGVNWVLPRAVDLNERWKPPYWVVDAGSTAGSLIGPMRDAGLIVREVGSRDITQAAGRFFDAAEEMDPLDQRIRHRDQATLNRAVEGARQRKVGQSWAFHRHSTSTDITPLVAVANASFGLDEMDPPSPPASPRQATESVVEHDPMNLATAGF